MQIITLGIGPGTNNIKFLVLTGLDIAPPPPPIPVPTTTGLLQPGQVAILLSEYPSAEDDTSDILSLPNDALELTWQVLFDSVPSVANVILQGSIDSINWATLDSITDTAGGIKSLPTAARFIRILFGTMDSDILTTVTAVVNPINYSGL